MNYAVWNEVIGDWASPEPPAPKASRKRNPDRYWDESLSPVTGCSPIPGPCDHCWARAMVTRFPHLHGYRVELGHEESDWEPRPFECVNFHPKALAKLSHWRRPRIVALSWLGDLFHADVTGGQIGTVIGAMDKAPQHTYLVLTKRPARMVTQVQYLLTGLPGLAWWGASAWDQASTDAALVHLERIHAVGGRTWLSLEPLLSRVDLPTHPPIDWLVVGPETGPGKRPCKEIWMDMLGAWCREVAQIPVWFKGMGDGWPHERPEGMVPR